MTPTTFRATLRGHLTLQQEDMYETHFSNPSHKIHGEYHPAGKGFRALRQVIIRQQDQDMSLTMTGI